MYKVTYSTHFERDIKKCKKRHWDIDALKQAINDLLVSDKVALRTSYRDHALGGDLAGYRAIHIDSASNPPKDIWVLMYRVKDKEIFLVRTGTHAEVYRK